MKDTFCQINSQTRRYCRYLVFALALLLGSVQSLSAQERNLTGQVTDPDGEPMIGVTVEVVSSNKGTITDMDGKYTIRIPEKAVVRFSYLGYKTKAINVTEKTKSLNVTMEEDAVLLEETVVTAMDIRRDEKSLATAYQKVDMEGMSETRDANFINNLAGKVAGLRVISNGVGGSTRVEIRGNNSIGGDNQPLYVIDGIPIVNEMGESGDLDYGNPANSINPDDVESMVVLKGANASALYGSSAANGAILITTKQAGKRRGMGITFSSNLQFSELSQFPIYQNVYGVGAGGRLNDGYNIYNSSSTTYDPSLPWGIANLTSRSYNQRSQGFPMLGFDVVGRNGEIKKYSPYPGNVTDMYKTGHSWTNSVSVERATEHINVRFSYSNMQSDDILENFNEIGRNTFNLRTSVKLTDFLKVDVNGRYSNEHANNRGFRNASSRNPIYSIAWMPRDVTPAELTPWKNPDGTSVVFPGGFNNPYWLLNELSNEDEKNWLFADASVEVKFTKDLKLRLKGAIDTGNTHGWLFVNKYSPFDSDGEYQDFSEVYRNDTYEALLSYNKRWKKFNVSAGVGATAQDYYRKKKKAAVYTLLQPDDKTLANNGASIAAWEEYNAKKKQAVFGTASVGYKDFIYLDLTGRNDWTSTLPAHNRSYFYSSVGASFILTDAFKIPENILSYAKLRASYASVGNDTGFDMLLDGYSYGNIYLGNMPWYESDSYKKNPDLRPESTTSYEFGTDLRFWKNRIELDFTYYTKRTKDQILRSRISSGSGYSEAVYNAGEVKNWGTELSLRITPIQTRNFSWTTSIDWAKNNSRIISLPNNMESLQVRKHNSTEVRIVQGRSYGTLYATTWKTDDAGRVLVDANGRAIEAQGQLLGDVSPDWLGGFNNSFTIGNITASFLIDFKKGGLLWSGTSAQGSRDGQTIESLQGRDEYLFSNWVLGENNEERKGFLQTGHTVTPGANYNTNTVPYYDSERLKGVRIPNAYFDESVDYWAGQPSYININPHNYWTDDSGKNGRLALYDASHIKLRELSVGYNFPRKLLNKIGVIQTMKVSFVGRNLAILYQKTPKGLDPEATSSMGNGQGIENGFSLPSATYGFDVRITF